MPRMIREYGAAGGGAAPPTQPKKRPLPPKLFGGWTATLEDPESYQSRTIDRAEDVLGGEEAIDETQPKEIFKGLNRSEQQKRAMELRKLSMTGGVPMRESTKPRLGSGRWWKNISENAINHPDRGKFFSEQIDKVLSENMGYDSMPIDGYAAPSPAATPLFGKGSSPDVYDLESDTADRDLERFTIGFNQGREFIDKLEALSRLELISLQTFLKNLGIQDRLGDYFKD